MGRWLGVSHRVGSDLCYYILKENGEIISRSTVGSLPDKDRNQEDIKVQLQRSSKSIDEHVRDTEFILQPTEENQLFILDIDDIDNEMIYNPVEEVMVDADEFEDIETYDSYIGMELQLPVANEFKRGREVKRAKGEDGKLIGISDSNIFKDISVMRLSLMMVRLMSL